jgi:glutamine---fructose-6-phosphate transaminase (isomerizing)
MCGIIAYIGNKNVFNNLFNGLKQLQNRGYDSAGICLSNGSEYINKKFASHDNINALDKLDYSFKSVDMSMNVGIGHTRWATHGPKTDINSHPHYDMYNKIVLVHNGIIENYLKLKQFLLKEGYVFKSQTDTEIIVNLISYNYLKNRNLSESIKITTSMLEGTYALCILCKDYPDTIFSVRHGSPLLIGLNENEAFLSSEQSGFCGNVNSYICLENNDICVLKLKEDKITMDTQVIYKNHKINKMNEKFTPDPYKHWTLKEIYDQVESSKRAISFGGRLLDNNKVKLGGLNDNIEILKGIDNIIFLGCGTSYHAGLLGVNYFKDLCTFNTVQVFDGAEFTERDIPKIGNTCLVLLSQSGETKDLHRCIKIGKDGDHFLIGVINVVDSMIAREVNCGCYLNAGREVGVASTKAFTSQCIILSMMAIWFSQQKNINNNKRLQYIKDLRRLYLDIDKTINNSKKQCRNVLKLFNNRQSIFLLGKGKCEAIAKEGALKIKEISYIHSEGYSGSSLKHGPFGLLDKGFPIILIDPLNNHNAKMANVYEEVKSRYAEVITITNNKEIERDNIIYIESNNTYSDLLSIIPLQLLAYQLSISKGINPDFPRNLAKVVTVE